MIVAPKQVDENQVDFNFYHGNFEKVAGPEEGRFVLRHRTDESQNKYVERTVEEEKKEITWTGMPPYL